jgi:hypothetical protein
MAWTMRYNGNACNIQESVTPNLGGETLYIISLKET